MIRQELHLLMLMFSQVSFLLLVYLTTTISNLTQLVRVSLTHTIYACTLSSSQTAFISTLKCHPIFLYFHVLITACTEGNHCKPNKLDGMLIKRNNFMQYLDEHLPSSLSTSF